MSQSTLKEIKTVQDFHNGYCLTGLLKASLSYHIEQGFDLRSKLLVDGKTAVCDGANKGVHGQALEALFGSGLNSRKTADFTDAHSGELLEMKLAKARSVKSTAGNWFPREKVKLQSHQHSLENVDEAWEAFVKKCSSIVLVLRETPVDPNGSYATGPLGLVYQSRIVRALELDFDNFSEETLSALKEDFATLHNLFQDCFAVTDSDLNEAYRLLGSEQKGETQYLALNTSGSNKDGQQRRSWYLKDASSVQLLIERELGRGIRDCSHEGFFEEDLLFQPEVYSVMQGLLEGDLQDILDPNSEVRSDPAVVERQRAKITATPKNNPAQIRICEDCHMTGGSAQDLCDFCGEPLVQRVS